MPNNLESCAFCSISGEQERIIRAGGLFASFVSVPQFRPGHSLVIPTRHITTPGEMQAKEAAEVMMELGRLSVLLNDGFGTGIMQKSQPLQSENGIKMNHLHFHVFPRQEEESQLFPTPQPNNFDGFYTPDPGDITELVARLR